MLEGPSGAQMASVEQHENADEAGSREQTWNWRLALPSTELRATTLLHPFWLQAAAKKLREFLDQECRALFRAL
jgi:hypothetical protein